jgi:putative aldouronate transport system permease protein
MVGAFMKNIGSRFSSDTVFDILVRVFLILFFLMIAYPLYFIIIASVSNPDAVRTGSVWFYPKGFNLEGYRTIFQYEKIWLGYRNTVFYTTFGTLISLFVTMPAAYALSRKDLIPRKFFMLFFTIVMFFQGGLIPTFLVISKFNMVNKIWVMLIPFCINIYNLIIARTFFQNGIPQEIQEAAIIDGCGDGTLFVKIVLPLSKAVIAVIALYYAVDQWNNYFRPMIYIRNDAIQVLQVFLRDILVLNQYMETMDAEDYNAMQTLADMIKYGVIIVSALPMIIFYPFLQKYFVKGVMIGSVKG